MVENCKILRKTFFKSVHWYDIIYALSMRVFANISKEALSKRKI